MKKIIKILIISISVFIASLFYCNNKMEYSYNKSKDSIDNAKNNNMKNISSTFIEEIPLKYNNESVCILMYHSIDYEKNNDLRMPKEKFREQMKYIKEQGYSTLTLSELYDFFANNKPIPKKSVVITLDDGYVDNYTNAYPILKEYGIKATIFVITDCIDKNSSYLNSKQLRDLQENGIDIESHTTHHEDLSKMSYKRQVESLKASREVLEKILNKDVKYIAYPSGKYNEDTLKAVKEAGYDMAFTTGGKFGKAANGIYSIKRIGVYSSNGMEIIKGNLNSN